MTRWSIPLLSLAFSIAPPSVLTAQERGDTSRVTITGTVVDRYTRQSVRNALVQLPELDLTVFSDESGRFTLSNLRRGVYQMVVTKPGYVPSEGEFAVERAGTFELVLNPVAPSDPTARSTIIGWVTDRTSGQPLASAIVSVPSLGLRRLTDRRG